MNIARFTRRPWLGPLRLLLGAASCLVALLVLLPAPTALLWRLSVALIEWGHLLVPLTLAPLVPGWRRSGTGRLGAAFGLAATLLFLTPLLRALPVARQLPRDMTAAFGPMPSRGLAAAVTRPAPLVFADLLRGVAVPAGQPLRRVYAERAGQALFVDLYQPPAQAQPAPVLLIIHGGAWQGGDPAEFAWFSRYFAARGYLVAAISYRLAPAHPFPAAYDDVRAAIAYLRANHAELGLDPGRLALLGRSAGGQLALLSAYTAHDPAIRAVVAFYAPTDLRFGYANPTNPRVLDSRAMLEAYLGGSPTTHSAAYDAAAPISFVEPDSPPTLLIHGQRDDLVAFAHSQRLAARLQASGTPHYLLRLPWATHACDYVFSGPSGQLSTFAIERFLGAVMR